MMERIWDGSQLMPNQRLLPLIRPYWNKLTYHCAYLGPQKTSKEAGDLLLKFVDMFSRHDFNLGETLVVEHEVKLELNLWPFHKRNHPVPQSMYEEFQKHLQEMSEVRAIRPSSSPWAVSSGSGPEKEMANCSFALTDVD